MEAAEDNNARSREGSPRAQKRQSTVPQEDIGVPCLSNQKGDEEESAVQSSTSSLVTPKRIYSSTCEKVILTPHPDDILMGRGRATNIHPGNKKMLGLVGEHKERYNNLARSDKSDVVKKLLRVLRENGSLFLKRVSVRYKGETVKGWEVASKGEAYEKVCHALREKPRRRNPGQAPETHSSTSASQSLPSESDVTNSRRDATTLQNPALSADPITLRRHQIFVLPGTSGHSLSSRTSLAASIQHRLSEWNGTGTAVPRPLSSRHTPGAQVTLSVPPRASFDPFIRSTRLPAGYTPHGQSNREIDRVGEVAHFASGQNVTNRMLTFDPMFQLDPDDNLQRRRGI